MGKRLSGYAVFALFFLIVVKAVRFFVRQPGGYVYLPYDRRKHLFQRTAGLNHNEKTAPHRLFEPVRGRSI